MRHHFEALETQSQSMHRELGIVAVCGDKFGPFDGLGALAFELSSSRHQGFVNGLRPSGSKGSTLVPKGWKDHALDALGFVAAPIVFLLAVAAQLLVAK